MPSLPKYPVICVEDRAYFAGLFDGEGCVLIHKSKKKSSIGYTLEVHFCISYKPILVKMKEYFGGNLYVKDMEKRINSNSVKKSSDAGCCQPDKWKQTYTYYMSSSEALYFLKVIEPFCNEKKKQVSLSIEYEEKKRPYSGGAGRSDNETKRCEFFYQELKRLKKEQYIEGETKSEVGFEDEQQDLFSF